MFFQNKPYKNNVSSNYARKYLSHAAKKMSMKLRDLKENRYQQ